MAIGQKYEIITLIRFQGVLGKQEISKEFNGGLVYKMLKDLEEFGLVQYVPNTQMRKDRRRELSFSVRDVCHNFYLNYAGSLFGSSSKDRYDEFLGILVPKKEGFKERPVQFENIQKALVKSESFFKKRFEEIKQNPNII